MYKIYFAIIICIKIKYKIANCTYEYKGCRIMMTKVMKHARLSTQIS